MISQENLATVIFGVFALVFGIVAVIYHFSALWTGLTLISVTVGNSASRMVFHVSQKGVSISSEKKVN